MKLRKVQIYGFKTFADKTDIEVNADLIAVVGPNGCGKSNIVDAILWGLGETKASHIRAKTSTEVIFSGSTRRKRLGFCEVTLYFDNEDASLPIDTPEVAVTRRLTRSGDSQYKINGRNCRLRDVNDLLADSGLGRAGYAIVGQQEIDQALAASPERRRNWIDEAAGVMRYRVRRIESLRRLASAQEHLDRVHDIIKEIEKQRGPLARDAENAKRYKQVQQTLRSMESGLLITDLAKAVQKLTEIEEQLKTAMQMVEQESAAAEALEKEAHEGTVQLEQVESDIEAAREVYQAARTGLEQLNTALQVAKSKLEGLDALEESISDDDSVSKERIEEARADLKKSDTEAAAETEALEKLRVSLSGADQEAKDLTLELRSVDAQVASARAESAEVQKQQVEEEQREKRLKDIKEEIAGIDEAVPELKKAIKEASKAFGKVESEMNKVRAVSYTHLRAHET